ncbi:MAG: hypothetical protein ACTTH5_04600 [Wolinella sp.]
MYSFTTPQPKQIFLKLTRIWLLYSSLTFLTFSLFVSFLQFQRSFMIHSAVENTMNRQSLLKESEDVREKIEKIKFEKEFAEDLKAQNTLLSESVKNLFELVPDQITLDSIEIKHDMLTIKGITPSKELYRFLLEVPLRSIFHDSRADFYPLSNGWFSFVSVSRAQEEHHDKTAQ